MNVRDLIATLCPYCLNRVFVNRVLICTLYKGAYAYQLLVLQTRDCRAMANVFIVQNIRIHLQIKDIVKKILATTPTSICWRVVSVQIAINT